MLVAKTETRPKCRWKDHKWKMFEYAVFEDHVYKVYKCTKCGRIKHDPLS